MKIAQTVFALLQNLRSGEGATLSSSSFPLYDGTYEICIGRREDNVLEVRKSKVVHVYSNCACAFDKPYAISGEGVKPHCCQPNVKYLR